MTAPSPLLKNDLDAGAAVLPWGPPEAPVEVVDTFGDPASEYAALRKGAVLIDEPHRALVEITGADRLGFLDRMLTAPVKNLGALRAMESFWCSRKGRIVADVRLIEAGGRILADLDSHTTASFIESLGAYIIADDVELLDRSGAMHRVSLIGPLAIGALGACVEPVDGGAPADLGQDMAAVVRIGGAQITIVRSDQTGEPGFTLWMAPDDAHSVIRAVLESCEQEGLAPVRRAGWAAFNIARIEAGAPLFRVDFGPDSLPHETGVVNERVSFKKGCYLGQEIVARMQSLGGPKQMIRGIEPLAPNPEAPEAGDQLFPADAGDDAKAVGVVTSSTISPMLSGKPIALAMIRSSHFQPGTTLRTVEGDQWRIREHLRFWPRPPADA